MDDLGDNGFFQDERKEPAVPGIRAYCTPRLVRPVLSKGFGPRCRLLTPTLLPPQAPGIQRLGALPPAGATTGAFV